jgi:hypothetical protein
VVARVIDRDRDQEGAQRRLEAVPAHGPRQGHEHLVHQIFSGGRVTHQARGERAHRALVLIVDLAHRSRICSG